MRRFTEEEITTLKEWENNFLTATKSNYKRATVRKNDLKIREIAEAAGMEGLTTNFGCGNCSLNFYRKVGEKYFEDKKYYEEENNKALNIITYDAPTDNRKDMGKGRKSTKRSSNSKNK